MPVDIIAEIGVNHNRDGTKGLELIDAAKHAGATAVKFQACIPCLETSAFHAASHMAMIGNLVPPFSLLEMWADYSHRMGIEFMCTASDPWSLGELLTNPIFDLKRIKVSSDNLTHFPMLRTAAASRLPMILSTGMACVSEIDEVVMMLRGIAGRITLLHCVSAYPTPIDEANLASIPYMQKRYCLPVGWSDHTTSVYLPAVAVGLGASAIEKHITLDRGAVGPDHAASLEPYQFREMVRAIRDAERAMGTPGKTVQPSELQTRAVSGKSLVASVAIAAGEEFTSRNVAIMRPGTGVSPMVYGDLLLRVADRAYQPGEQIDRWMK